MPQKLFIDPASLDQNALFNRMVLPPLSIRSEPKVRYLKKLLREGEIFYSRFPIKEVIDESTLEEVDWAKEGF